MADICADKINTLRKQIWIIEGILKYDFDEEELLKVINRHSAIGFVPQGYLYPELLSRTKMPTELSKAMKNKERHNKKRINQ